MLSVLQALMRASAIGKPVIVTETGIPDGADSHRELWSTSYLRVVSASDSRLFGIHEQVLRLSCRYDCTDFCPG